MTTGVDTALRQLYEQGVRRKPNCLVSRPTQTMGCLATSPLMADTTLLYAAERDFDSIVQQYRLRVFRFILASLRDGDAAETLTQDCFFNAYQGLSEFRGDCGMETWLLKIAVNLVRDHARSRRLQFWKRARASAKPLEDVEYRLSDNRQSAEAGIAVNQQVRAVWNAAAKLPERQRTVFLLRFVEDMDLLEIAAATGLKEGTVKTHLFRALQAVREQIGAKA